MESKLALADSTAQPIHTALYAARQRGGGRPGRRGAHRGGGRGRQQPFVHSSNSGHSRPDLETDVVAAAIHPQITTYPCAKSVKSEATWLAYVGTAMTSNLLLHQTAALVRCMHLQATLQVIGIWILVQILT